MGKRSVVMCVVQYHQELTTGQLTTLDLVKQVSTMPIDGIELRRETWQNYQAELDTVREMMQAHGKIVTYATFSNLFSPTEEAHAMLLHDINTTKELGSPLLRVFSGAIPEDLTDTLWLSARDAVTYAEDCGVAISLENWGKPPGSTLKEIALVLEHIPSSALKTNVDIGNYAGQNEDVLHAIQTLTPRINYAHLKDIPADNPTGTTALGEGTLPISAIMDAFSACPQEIIYCFEFAGDGDAMGRIDRSHSYLQRWLS